MLHFVLLVNTPILKSSCIETSKLKSQANDCEIQKYLMLALPYQLLSIIGKVPKVGTEKY